MAVPSSLLLAAAFCVSVFNINAVQFKDCGSKTGKVESVKVDGCAEDDDKCVLKRGSQAHFTINFKGLQDVTSMHAKVHGVIGGVPIPFPLPQSNACQNSGIQCPLKSGKTYAYATTISVLEVYPPISVEVKWELEDPSMANDVICIKIQTQLQ